MLNVARSSASSVRGTRIGVKGKNMKKAARHKSNGSEMRSHYDIPWDKAVRETWEVYLSLLGPKAGS